MKKSLWLIPLLLFISLCILIAYTQTQEQNPASVTLITTASTPAVSTAPDTTTISTTTTTYVVNYDLNTATERDLMTIDGIGETIAKRILTLRTEKNGFVSRSELLEVDGIGSALLERIMTKFYITNEAVITTTARTTTEHIITTTTSVTTTTTHFYLELNTVTAEELMTVPGINKELAAEIIAFREAIGSFSHPYELCLVGNHTTDWWADRIGYFYVDGCTDPVVTTTASPPTAE